MVAGRGGGKACCELLADCCGCATVPEVVTAEEVTLIAAPGSVGHLPPTGTGPLGAYVVAAGATDTVAYQTPEDVFVGILPGQGPETGEGGVKVLEEGGALRWWWGLGV